MKKPPLQLSVFCGFPSYGGNGGISSEVPDIREWWTETVLKIGKDPRISGLVTKTIADTPITMVRNDFVRLAKANGCDLLLMVDSDQSPNKHADAPWFKPFWDEAFNFIYENYHKGPHVVFAPYVGPAENVYVFYWEDHGNKGIESEFELKPYSRQHAAIMSGIQEAAAGPTGLILIDLRACELIEPSGLPRREVLERVQSGQMTPEEAEWALHEGYFHYEWENSYADKKASTEDVTFTRNIALAGMEQLGYNPLYCAWDSWIGHHKPINVGRPQRYTTEQVHQTLRKSVRENSFNNEVCMDLSRLDIDPALKQFVPTSDNIVRTVETADVTRDGVRETTGPWFVHGHAPKEHCDALADLVRQQCYAKQRQIRALEVGSWLGTTALAMVQAGAESVHCVDTWQGTPTDCTGECAKVACEEAGDENAVYSEFLKRVKDHLDKKIFPWKQTSAEAAAKYWEPFDLIFIDAEHTYDETRADILAWWPHLAENGIMVGHDFSTRNYKGVTQAVEELFGDKLRTCGWHPQGALWWVAKSDFPQGLLPEKSNGHVAHA